MVNWSRRLLVFGLTVAVVACDRQEPATPKEPGVRSGAAASKPGDFPVAVSSEPAFPAAGSAPQVGVESIPAPPSQGRGALSGAKPSVDVMKANAHPGPAVGGASSPDQDSAVFDPIAAMHDDAVKALAGEDADRRQQALRALEPEDPADLSLIEHALLADRARDVRREAAAMLSFGRFPESLPTLIKALEDADPAVVAAAIEALSWHGETAPNLIDTLRPLATHPDAAIRDEARTALEIMQ